MSLDTIKLWHERARPNPTAENFNVQLGCHFEEVGEMLDELDFDSTWSALRQDIKDLATRLKKGREHATIVNRKKFLDSIGDQVVTGVGVGHTANMNAVEATARINTSNWSKFDEQGMPIFDANGKITKGPKYKEPVLDGLY